jgi:hypothetical protein
VYHIVNLVFQPPFPPFHPHPYPRLAHSIASPSNPPPSHQRFRGNRARARSRGADTATTSSRSRSELSFPEGVDRARARAQLATLASMARRTDSGPVRANLADQTGAKSRAFVRVNSIHELSILRTSPTLPAPSASAGRGVRAGFIPSASPTFYGAASSRAIHDRSNR